MQNYFNQWLNTIPIVAAEICDEVTLFCAPIKDRSFELVFGGSELDQQLKNTILHSQGISRITINLVDHKDGQNSLRQRLSQHEPGLCLRTLKRIDDQKDPVHHSHNSLNLTSKIGMTWRIYDIDGLIPPLNRSIL